MMCYSAKEELLAKGAGSSSYGHRFACVPALRVTGSIYVVGLFSGSKSPWDVH